MKKVQAGEGGGGFMTFLILLCTRQILECLEKMILTIFMCTIQLNSSNPETLFRTLIDPPNKVCERFLSQFRSFFLHHHTYLVVT